MIRYLYTGDYDDNEDNYDANTILVRDMKPKKMGSIFSGFQDVDDWGRPRSVTKKKAKFPDDMPSIGTAFYPITESSQFFFNTKMYTLGDKYCIPGLKRLATTKYKDVASSHAVGTSFIRAADFLLANTVESDHEMADVVARTANVNINYLLDNEEFRELLKGNGKLSLDLVGLLSGRDLGGKRK